MFRSVAARVLVRAPRLALAATVPRQQQITRTFTSSITAFGRGSVDKELGDKIASELAIEDEMRQEPAPESFSQFLDMSGFSIEDVPGKHEVTLTRKFGGNETIKIIFSANELSNVDEMDEGEVEGSSSGGANGGEDGEDAGPSFPVPCFITIAKDNASQTLCIDAIAQDGVLVVENACLYEPKLAADDSSSGDYARRELYGGPLYNNLDEELQMLMEKYLEERAIDTNLALFIPDYVDYKEAREYGDWLKKLGQFVEA
ncbi:Mitochondrial acidic protein mam33 [Savitreella phatthalungensis]